MASTPKILTYHVVPRFDIAAKGGPLALGTVVADIKRMVPLNRGAFHVQVPEDLKYTPVTQTDFKDTLIKARNANTKGWLKALGLPVGASSDIGGSSELENTISCESITTVYFDPDPAGQYVKECLAVKPVQDWLDASKHRTANLYIVTGLKVAKKLKFNTSNTAEMHANAEIQANEPLTNAVEIGVGGNAGSKNQQALEFEVDDIILGVRFNLFHCVKHLFGKGRDTKDRGVLDGDMMSDQIKPAKQAEFSFELIPIPEGKAIEDEAAAAGERECWVSLDALRP